MISVEAVEGILINIRRRLGFIVLPRSLGRLLGRLNWRLRDWYYEIRNRFFARYYLVDIKNMPRGAWWDADYRMFHAVFQILVDYVEQECAHLSKISYTKGEQYDDIHPDIVIWQNASWWSKWYNRQSWNERLGIAHLEWEASLDDEHGNGQAEKGRQALELYKWYKYERPSRKDPFDGEYDGPHYIHEKGGFTDGMIEDEPTGEKIFNPFSKKVEDTFRGRTMTDEYQQYIRKCGQLEEFYQTEDTIRAQQVLAIRRGLWT